MEDEIAKKIVSYLNSEVSSDISTRLEFARNQALKKIKRPVLPWYKNITLPSLSFKNKIVWATSAIVALVVIGFSSELMQIQDSDSDEITYHMQADKLPSYIVDDI